MLKLSKKWSYAIKAMIYIAQSKKLIHIIDISSAENISESLLRRIISDLEKNNLIKTTQWRNGGIVLWKEVQKISVYDILFAVWEELGITDCTRGAICDKIHGCSTTYFLNTLQGWFNSLLKMYTLDKIMR